MNLQQRINTPSDINEHLQTLHDLVRSLSMYQPRVVEFGTRTGNSTCAFLTAGAIVNSYDIKPAKYKPETQEMADRWIFTQADTGSDSLKVPIHEILFIDSLHTYDHVTKELRYAYNTRNFIVFHDTVLFGGQGENGEIGICPAIFDFLAQSDEWEVAGHFANNNGLLILERKQ